MTSTQAAAIGDTLVTGHAAVRAALADPRLAVPPVGPATAADREHRTTAWLRAEAARFADGEPHTRRRALVANCLAGVAPDALGAAARTTTAAILGRRAEPVDVMAELARRVPVRVVGAALGAGESDLDSLVAAILSIAPAYQPGAPDHAVRRADEGVARVAAILRPGPGTRNGTGDDERTANLVAILVQTCDATAGLIGNTAVAALPAGPRVADAKSTEGAKSAERPEHPGYPGIPVAALVHETLRLDPPVRGTRRRTTAPVPELGLPEGASVFLDFAGANRDPDVFPDPDTFDPARGHTAHLTFGHGLHACPGRDHALAIACGVLEALSADGRRRVDTPVAYEAHPVLRIPASLFVEPR
ncbi:cytochrome P450 [Streptodolium elevatio]|uniref:Cytochrome P450 n=1 Tax=Streptodolium elevatio TaxID=3157996 RepID=A0ABV3DM37_9ACTN